MRRRLLFATVAALGCGGKPAGMLAGDTFTERRSFDVVATLLPPPGSAFASNMPTRIPFTLALEPGAGRVIAGGGGQARTIPLGSGQDGTFHISTRFDVGVSQRPCSGLVGLQFASADVSVAGDRLTGAAQGQLVFATGTKDQVTEPFHADLTGARDTTPPFLILPTGATLDDPLAPYQVWTSEPLPDSALARLVGRDGAVAGLVPEVTEGAVALIASFAKPNLTMPPGAGFDAVYSDDVVDLAGNVARMGEALRLPEIPAAPLLAPDGFEAATGDGVGGASLVRDQPGITIAGSASAYLAPGGAPWVPTVTPSTTLIARMAVPAGATKLALSYREILQIPGKALPESIQLGSVGRAPGMAMPIPAPTAFTPIVWVTSPFQASEAAMLEVPLPDDVGPEVVVVIRAQDGCGEPLDVPGLVVDDLRLE